MCCPFYFIENFHGPMNNTFRRFLKMLFDMYHMFLPLNNVLNNGKNPKNDTVLNVERNMIYSFFYQEYKNVNLLNIQSCLVNTV